jgi:N-formylglutamate amidohydrolase
MEAPFSLLGSDVPQTPILFAIPHAGRCYPAEQLKLVRLQTAQLKILEDRYADRLIDRAVDAGHGCVIAHMARAWIDLNRNVDEIDSAMIVAEDRSILSQRMTSKVRGGLGLIPRRLAQGGDIWREPLSARDIASRITSVHQPYHSAVARALEDRLKRFGQSILIDLHSMPPLKPHPGQHAANFVVGDLFGRSAHPNLVECAMDEIAEAGFRVSRNQPYAGGYGLDRHGAPHRGVHAIQIEVDRRLYLDAALDQPGQGAAAVSHLVLRLANRLTEALQSHALPIAAE